MYSTKGQVVDDMPNGWTLVRLEPRKADDPTENAPASPMYVAEGRHDTGRVIRYSGVSPVQALAGLLASIASEHREHVG